MHTPAAVIFDMDGLLMDTERVALRTFHEAADGLGITVPDGLYESLIGRTWRTNQVQMREALGADAAEAISAAWDRAFEARVAVEGIPKKPGADALLEMLSRRGVPRAVATSNARRYAVAQLRDADLLAYFPVVTAGDEVDRGKPAPDIFLATARRLGTRPAACVVLEDSEAGVAAAAAAGMRVIMVPDLVTPTRETAALAERVCPSLAEAHAFLESILSS